MGDAAFVPIVGVSDIARIVALRTADQAKQSALKQMCFRIGLFITAQTEMPVSCVVGMPDVVRGMTEGGQDLRFGFSAERTAIDYGSVPVTGCRRLRFDLPVVNVLVRIVLTDRAA